MDMATEAGLVPAELVDRLAKFEDFNRWVSNRVYPAGFRVARASLIVYASLMAVELARQGPAIFVRGLGCKLLALAFQAIMAGFLGCARLGRSRAALTLSAGLAAQSIMVYNNAVAPGHFAYIPFIIFFFLYGVLVISPCVPIWLYFVFATLTALSLWLILVFTGISREEMIQTGIMVIPALVFLGHATWTQRNQAREMWRLARENHIKSTIDALSLVLNRRAWYERGGPAVEACRRETPCDGLACLMLDIDHFKSINDSRGHECGDMVIRKVAAAMLAETRRDDLVGRLGGEEFAILLPGMGRAEALTVAERIRHRVEGLGLTYGEAAVPVTVSLGLAAADDDGVRDLDSLLRSADACLYKAKGAGRNRVVPA